MCYETNKSKYVKFRTQLQIFSQFDTKTRHKVLSELENGVKHNAVILNLITI